MVVGEVAVEVDTVVVGGGPGGYTAAIRLGQLGKSVVLIEKNQLGGVCLNRGCIPSKALIQMAEKFDELTHLKEMGVELPGKPASIDLHKWQKWKQEITTKLNTGIHQLCQQNGVTVVTGEAHFLSSHRVGVETGNAFDVYKFEHAIVATGSSPRSLPFAEVDHTYILDSTSALELTEVPRSLSIVGGGYIGMELGLAFAKLGSAVTIVEMSPHILPATAPHISREVLKKAEKLGVTIKSSTSVEHLTVNDGYVELIVQSNGEQETLQSEKALMTVGRSPNTKGLGLEQVGVFFNEDGTLPINEECRTNIDHIFAIGDVTEGPALAHKASKQGIVAAEVIGGLPSAIDSSYIPYVVFTDPQIAGVGLTAKQAQEQGHRVKTARFPFQANGLALVASKPDGFAEVIVDEESHLLLGFHIVGADASNLIGEGVLALELGARVEDVALTVHPHPTFSEGWLGAAEAALGHAIHVVNK
ncbi:dihydrolipoyl dehydrogenase [Halalkalibacterium halodurans]|jgi:dihydrolipoamide dehydrogenase|uniref:Dihydrolipoyl dehydrogenase n=1 Tax=Halalkalibacterium halodurans TaxID=86665 RepID=A0A0M0KDF4_ALKHA|nr:dihydrolipoyl dehydrogenase [Halalkalibacterium halodurans]MED4081315.1 dihydrolipoyl dehydrogenase [Halalkalibacterium halodurans]MED4084030.1 dihydrolipoyl dehydrogenase [Halalkalibacterium halodurans]MED4105965.1 dihydrolipoyl dehydrogenase [Halalkalibacterium halodurans]MED4107361.1 dihydrolipoyl dehydrogenase [Halalkalibacterium halodurans]MED4148806.1 dihydrolipoyl dehydrogenase [Halalkalibacterium halodurans]